MQCETFSGQAALATQYLPASKSTFIVGLQSTRKAAGKRMMRWLVYNIPYSLWLTALQIPLQKQL